jgi:hypothetical protein
MFGYGVQLRGLADDGHDFRIVQIVSISVATMTQVTARQLARILVQVRPRMSHADG